jgi:hypothetical protein
MVAENSLARRSMSQPIVLSIGIPIALAVTTSVVIPEQADNNFSGRKSFPAKPDAKPSMAFNTGEVHH